MPIHFRREDLAEQPVPRHDEHDHGDLRAGLLAAVRACLPCLAVAAVALLIGLKMMKPALLASDHLLHHGQGDHWQEMWMPIVLFVFFGAIFGAALVWRIDARTSLGGTSICLAATAAAALLLAVGALGAAVIFGGTVPLMGWLSLGTMLLAAIAGAYGSTRWTG